VNGFLGAALALVPVASASAGDGLVFAVRPGSVVEKSFKVEHGLSLQKAQLEGEGAAQLSVQQLEIASTVTLDVSDTYRRIESGRPLELRRLVRGGALHVEITTIDPLGTKTPDAWDAVTPLEGKSVVYAWVPEEKGYGRHYDEVESLEEYLSALSEDLDLRCFLPRDPSIGEGEKWTIDPARLVDVFAPGGDIPLGFVKSGSGAFVRALSAGVGGPLHAVFGGVIKGNASARWAETREVEGVRLARIELAVSIETDHDRTEAARAVLPRDDSTDTHEIERAGVRWKFDGSGTLQWNLEAGRFESFDLVGREDVSSDILMRFGTEASRQMIAMAGALKISARASAPGKDSAKPPEKSSGDK